MLTPLADGSEMGKTSRPTPFAFDLDEEQIRRERHKARELRASQWWKRRCAKGRCYWCDRTIPVQELTMDHVVPLSRGGLSVKSNVVPSCKECNSKKKQLLPMEWEAYVDSMRCLTHPDIAAVQGDGDEAGG